MSATTTTTTSHLGPPHCGPMPGHPGPVPMAALPHGAHPCYVYAAPPHPTVAVGSAPSASAPSPTPAPALLPHQPTQHNGTPMSMPHVPHMPHMSMHLTYAPSPHSVPPPQFRPGAVPMAMTMVPMSMVPVPGPHGVLPHPPCYPHHMAISHPLMPAAALPATVAAPEMTAPSAPCMLTAHRPSRGVVAAGRVSTSVARPPLAPWEAEPGVVDLRLLLLKSRDMRRKLRVSRRHATRPPHLRNHNECVKARRGAEFAAQLAAMDDAARLCGMLPPTTEEVLQHAELFAAQGFHTLPRRRPRTSDASASGAVADNDNEHQRVSMGERFGHHVSDCDANSSAHDDAADDDGEPTTTAASAARSSKTASGQNTPQTAIFHAPSEIVEDEGHCDAVALSQAETGVWSVPEMRSLFLTRVAFHSTAAPTAVNCAGMLSATEPQVQLPFLAARNFEVASEQYRDGDDGVLSGAATTREAVHAALYRKFVLSAAHHCKTPAH